MGIFGGLFYMALVFYLLVKSGLLAAQAPPGMTKDCLWALFTGMMGATLHLSLEPFYDNELTWVFMGLVASGIALQERNLQYAPMRYVGAQRPMDLIRKT